MIRKTFTIPDELPHCRLYLDDVEEITRILTDAVSLYFEQQHFSENYRDIKTSYVIGDSRADSIEDLRSIGGSCKKFSVSAEGSMGPLATVRFSGPVAPIVRLPVNENDALAAYAKIKSICERRSRKLKTVVVAYHATGAWWIIPLFFLCLAAIPQFAKSFVVLSAPGIVLIGLFALVVFADLALLFSPNRVFFSQSHEHSRRSAEGRKAFFEKVASFFAGGVVTLLVQWVSRHFMK